MSIINTSYFVNDLYLPFAAPTITGLPSATGINNNAHIEDVIEQVEKELLIYALGVTLYTELLTALGDIDNPLYVRWKNLIQGETYDGKIWEGLENSKSLIAYLVYAVYISENDTFLTQTGVQKPKHENSENVFYGYKYATAYQKFLKKYQNGYIVDPIITRSCNSVFIDYFGERDSVFVSMYQYLVDKLTEFPEWDKSKFRAYSDEINSFGL